MNRRADREDARDRLLLSISTALIEMMRLMPGPDRKVFDQVASNLTECNKDLLDAAGLEHGRPSGWRDCVNSR